MGGISGLLSTISLLGFALFIVGVVLVVTSASQGRPVRSGIALAIVGLVLGIFLSLIGSGILIVEPTQVAVVTNTLNGTLEEPARGAGTSVIIPVFQLATLYDTRQQEYTMSATTTEGAKAGNDAVEATTVDGQIVRVDVTIIYGVDRANVNTLHLRYGNDPDVWVANFIRPTARNVVRDIIATLPAEEIYGLRRGEMQASMSTEMADKMASQGFIMSSFLVRGLQFSDQFASAIEDKQIAQQRVEEAKQQAEQARTVAQGERDAAITRAEGDRDAAIAIAQGQAEALRLVSEQIAANPSLIMYEYVQNLSDNVRLIMVPSSSPFLFDLNSLGAANPNFLAPDTEVIPPSSTTTP
ncbi:MAG TPA: prohibitin family protein [Phototrophicaceae bacterium]|jgi:regulator of protease activity HflC (stomatin/prohibitin superfamily)|nr:prohibitin family protein [Phototrophicaceae bacterium]